MGLDMYLYRIKKPTVKFPEIITTKWLDEHELEHLPEKAINDKTCVQIKPYCIEKSIQVELIDIKRIIADRGITIDDSTSYATTMISSSAYGFSVYQGKERRDYITVPIRELREKYVYKEFEKAYIFKQEDVAYWRKYRNLQDHIYDMFCGNIYNCGYQKLTEEQVKDIMNFDQDNCNVYHPLFEIKENDEEGAYFYYEWY